MRYLNARAFGLGLYMLGLALPIYWLINMSFKTNEEITSGLTFWPHQPILSNYSKILTDPSWYLGYVHSLTYVLINMVLGLLLTLVFQMMPAQGQDPATLPPSTGVLFVLLLAMSFWGFRLTWLYIPYAVNLDARYYLTSLRGPFVSLSMIGAWMMCIVPFFLFMQVIGGFVHNVLQGTLGDTLASFLFVILIMAVDTLKNIIATAGIAFGLQEIFNKDKKAPVL